MDQAAFESYVTDRYQDQIRWYDQKAVANQRIYSRLQWPLLVLAAVTPVLIEVDLRELGFPLAHLATATSVVVAVLTASLKTFKYQENWIAYRTTCETLRKEKRYYDARLGEYRQAEDPEALFVERVEDLISRENTMWVTTHKTEHRQADRAPGR